MNLNLELMRVVFMYGKPSANDATHVSWKQECELILNLASIVCHNRKCPNAQLIRTSYSFLNIFISIAPHCVTAIVLHFLKEEK